MTPIGQRGMDLEIADRPLPVRAVGMDFDGEPARRPGGEAASRPVAPATSFFSMS